MLEATNKHAEISKAIEFVPLVGLQEPLYYLISSVTEMSAYNIPVTITFTGVINVDVLADAIDILLSKHKVLSAQITEKDHVPYQFYNNDNKIKILRKQHKEGLQLTQTIVKEARKPFSLLNQPLTRVILWEVSQHKTVLQLTISHIICDRHSLSTIVSDLLDIYRQIQHNQAKQPTFNHSPWFFQYAIKKSNSTRSKKHSEALAYWANKLKNFEPYQYISADYLKTENVSYEGAVAYKQFMSAVLVKKICAENKVRPYVFFVGALKALLNIYSGIDDIIVGTPVTTRSTEFSSAVGLFVNTLLLRSKVDSNENFKALLRKVEETIDEAMTYSETLTVDVIKHAKLNKELHKELFQCMIIYQNYDFETCRESDFTADVSLVDNATSKFDLSLFVFDTGQTFKLKIEYNTTIFKDKTITVLLNQFSTLLNWLAHFSDRPICEAQIADKSEMSQLFFKFGCGEKIKRSNVLVTQTLDIIAGDVEGENPAVIYENQMLTYKELAISADKVAFFLKQQGHGQGDIVGLNLEESLEILPSILGILKAGCVYLPLHPSYPKERLLAIVNDAKPACIIGSSKKSIYKTTAYQINL